MGEQKVKNPAQRDYERYYSMPKSFVGPEEADVLFSLYESMSLREKSFGYLYTAGSAASESALLALDQSVDVRHERLRRAKKTWQEAQDAFLFSHIDEGWNESRLFIVPDKVQMQLLYVDLYHEMVDSYVEDATLGKLHASLVSLAHRNKELHDYAEAIGDWGTAVGRRGLGYELGTLMTVTRLGCPSLFAVPATARADHGTHMANMAHDVRIIQQSHGKINWYVPFEVKPTDFHIADYQSAFVRGRVELLMPSSIQPLDVAEYMKAELEGTISEKHLGELDELTSRVLTLAKDYRAREEFENLMRASA